MHVVRTIMSRFWATRSPLLLTSIITILAIVLFITSASLLVAEGKSGSSENAVASPAEEASIPTETDIEIYSDFSPDNSFLLGLDISAGIFKEIGFSDDEGMIKRINDIGYRVGYWAQDPKKLYSFNIIKFKEPNAFALPGGFIFLTEGMMRIGLTDDELAMLIGHEIAHVKGNHFAKMQRRQGLLNMLQQLMLVGVLFGMHDEGRRTTTTYDPRREPEYYGSSGKWAVAQGLMTFGSLFRSMLELGFSRKLEFEADSNGFLYAIKAGYKPEALVNLMQKLNNHIYETPGIGYWRTHPYFHDRIARAKVKARLEQGGERTSIPLDSRQQVQDAFLKAAGVIRMTQPDYIERRLFLEKLAFQAFPTGENVDWILGNLLIARQQEELKKPLLLRHYNSLIHSLINAHEVIARVVPESPRLVELTRQRMILEAERDELLPRFLEILTWDDVNRQLLETFIANFPHHDKVPEVSLRLADMYRLSGDNRMALKSLFQATATNASPDIAQQAVEQKRLLFPQIKDPAMCMALIEDASSEEDRAVLHQRMETIIASELTLEYIADFLTQYPETEFSEKMKEAWETQAEREYNLGRILEAARDYQEALEVFNRIVTYANPTSFCERARQRIEYINTHHLK